MQKKKVFILLGHPDKDTYSGSLADAYMKGAQKNGHEVRRTNLGEVQFDPILHKGYKEIQALEPDLRKIQEDINWADHFVIVYPNWWNTMPALLKGMFDRMWLPGFAFNFDKQTKRLIQRLKGKSACVIVVAGTHSPFMTRWKFGDYTNEIEKGILEFSGLSPIRVTTFGPCDRVDEKQKATWQASVHALGEKAC
ncbi:MAG TPA: NAD(P)H-dependent oxidoreductase [Candidatus Paceibacterota bacterium]|jgi:putative NADPH-quinone reductase